jgi:hypothetical protein
MRKCGFLERTFGAAVASLLYVTLSAQQAPPAKPSVFDRPASNLKVLKVDPPQALRPIMMSFNSSLGVGCQFCHDDQDFAKDLPQKETARTMLSMVERLNTETFTKPDGPKVTCYTCHRGAQKPATSPAAR